MKNIYLFSLILILFFTFCCKQETETPKPETSKLENIGKQIIGNWNEVETTVKEYDKNNQLLNTTPNLSPIQVTFDGQQVTTTYTESFIPKSTRPYTITKANNKAYIEYDGYSRLFEITEISATHLTLVVKQMSSEFNGVTFEYLLYTRKLIKI